MHRIALALVLAAAPVVAFADDTPGTAATRRRTGDGERIVLLATRPTTSA